MQKRPPVRDNLHPQRIREQPCLVCGTIPSDAHHLRTDMKTKGMGLKPGDDKAVPLCRKHHMKLHAYGNEELWWSTQGIDPDENT